jgi:c-di-GMP-binding flagellar brake protein YcgR
LLDAPAGADENCYIDTPVGVASVLRAIAEARTRTAVYIDFGETLFHTCLLGVESEPAALYFDKGPDEAPNARLLECDRVVFVTSDQGVPVQFSCPAPRADSYQDFDAFSVPLPARVLRLQRRSYYRLPGEPVHGQVKCEIVVDGEEGETAQVLLTPRVLDLSCGGFGAGLSGTPALERGMRPTCRLDLPGVGKIEAMLEVRGATDIVLHDGLEGRRYGLAFVGLPPKGAAAIQRYILEQQRARKRVTG